MIDHDRLREQLGLHEGRRRFVYDDATGRSIISGALVRGIPTVGVGRNLADRGLSDDEIDYLLDNDIANALGEAQTFSWFASLDQVRQNVVVELIMNMGLPRFKTFKEFIRHMGERQWAHAAIELADSLWQKQVDPVLGDGKGRADVLIKMVRTGQWP